MWLAIKYAAFAVLSMAVNIGTQDLSTRIYSGPFEIYVALVMGTGTGLIVKYVLDKKYIFFYQSEGVKDDGQKFILYSFMGVFTTLIFWGTEIGFDWMFQTKTMRYTGGLLGLLIGYITKYQLDKRFVFKKQTP